MAQVQYFFFFLSKGCCSLTTEIATLCNNVRYIPNSKFHFSPQPPSSGRKLDGKRIQRVRYINSYLLIDEETVMNKIIILLKIIVNKCQICVVVDFAN